MMKESPVTKIPDEVISCVKVAQNIVLLTHAHPDGDALGSLLGLGNILRGMGKKVLCFLEEPVSHLYDFLPGADSIESDLGHYQRFLQDGHKSLLHIALDCGDGDRLGMFCEKFLQSSPFLVIDHHQSHTSFGTHRWVEANRSSTGEMVYEIACALGLELNYESAYCLYVAICTDTGSFRYSCTTTRTMQVAAALLEYGVKPEEVGHHLYDNYSMERLRLMEMALSTLSLHHDDRLAMMHVSAEMVEKSGATIKDVEGFIDLPRSLRSVDVAAFIKESGGGTIAVSLRAKGGCDVADVAKSFDGGGHRNAAGFRLEGKSIAEVQAEILTALDLALEAGKER